MRSCVVAVTLWSCAKGLWLDETEWMQVDSDRKLMRRERLGRERWEWGGGREGGRGSLAETNVLYTSMES